MSFSFQGSSVQSQRVIYTPTTFAKTNLLYLQEAGELQALQPHTSHRAGMTSYLFFIVTKGSGTLVYAEEKYQLHRGDCVFIDCKKAYSQSSSSEDLWALKWAHFYGYNLNGIYEKYVERGGQPAFTPKNSTLMSDLLTQLLDLAGSEDYIRDMKINEKITSLLTLIMSESWHPEKGNRIGLKKQSLHPVKVYLEVHYKERITLDSLSEQFFINKFYLTRMFKEQFGTTVLAYLDQVRITHAKQLLRFSDLTVESIGREVGIEDGAYFNRVFKKVEGVTPGEYRRMW
jgi:AraC-like DNA-binding protein/mannose-6-phosphate isomerase-like protein (cupin superfamily)